MCTGGMCVSEQAAIYLHGGETQPGELKAGTAVQLDNPQQD